MQFFCNNVQQKLSVVIFCEIWDWKFTYPIFQGIIPTAEMITFSITIVHRKLVISAYNIILVELYIFFSHILLQKVPTYRVIRRPFFLRSAYTYYLWKVVWILQISLYIFDKIQNQCTYFMIFIYWFIKKTQFKKLYASPSKNLNLNANVYQSFGS